MSEILKAISQVDLETKIGRVKVVHPLPDTTHQSVIEAAFLQVYQELVNQSIAEMIISLADVAPSEPLLVAIGRLLHRANQAGLQTAISVTDLTPQTKAKLEQLGFNQFCQIG